MHEVSEKYCPIRRIAELIERRSSWAASRFKTSTDEELCSRISRSWTWNHNLSSDKIIYFDRVS